MDNLKRLNQAMDYIESNLLTEIDMDEIAKIALCSEFHFAKMFSYLAEMTLSEYIRKRRLTLAAIDVKETDMKVLDIAVKYGYNSADSFSRAFYKMHGVLPSKAREGDVSFNTCPRLSFEINITGGAMIKARIVDKEKFNLVGFKKNVTIVHSGVNQEIQEMYSLLNPEVIGELKGISDIEPSGFISASLNFVDRHLDGVGTLDHFMGVASSQTIEKYSVTEVEACTWAVFESVGPFPQTLQDTWAKIYGQWFPSSNYVPTGGAELTKHFTQDMSAEDFKSEIWIPVKVTE